MSKTNRSILGVLTGAIMTLGILVPAAVADDDLLLGGDLFAEPAKKAPAATEEEDDLLGGGDLLGGDLLEDDGKDDGDLLGGGDLLDGDLTEEKDDGGDLLGGGGLLDGDLLDEPKEDEGGLLGGGDLLDGSLEDLEKKDEPGDVEPSAAEAAASAHEALFAESRYPSATTCATCHPKHYKEWSVSQHAYAQLSPVYMAMQNTINAKTSSTNGDFCIRCHNQVGMNMGESPFISNLDRHPTSREGITCVVCHRVDKAYGKISGRMGLVEGDLLTPVYGPSGNAELQRVLEDGEYKVVTDPDKSGRKIHTKAFRFEPISTSGFCGSCHDVNLFNGFRLEEAFSEYKHSPAALAGTSCQDCHMGKEQGKPSGYEVGPAAVVGGIPTKDRKITNHFFAGPDHSVVHPGIFPHNVKAAQLAELADWLKFNVEAGWGTDAFEDKVTDDQEFPEAWATADDRYDGRSIINQQMELLDWARDKRLEVLRNGYKLGDVEVARNSLRRGLKFKVGVRNGTDGHNVPTGFIAERLVWLEVTVRDPAGEVIFESGDLDPNGDVRDSHSLYVHNGELPLDTQLYSLQSKFMTRNVRGGEREQVLAVNTSVDPLPFIRPSTRSTVLTGQPAGARTHRLAIPPLARQWANYKVKAKDLKQAGTYQITARLKAGMVPVNLVDAIKGVGFDYGMSARDIAEKVVAGHEVLWETTTPVEVH